MTTRVPAKNYRGRNIPVSSARHRCNQTRCACTDSLYAKLSKMGHPMQFIEGGGGLGSTMMPRAFSSRRLSETIGSRPRPRDKDLQRGSVKRRSTARSRSSRQGDPRTHSTGGRRACRFPPRPRMSIVPGRPPTHPHRLQAREPAAGLSALRLVPARMTAALTGRLAAGGGVRCREARRGKVPDFNVPPKLAEAKSSPT
jgi:hypothetical protein